MYSKEIMINCTFMKNINFNKYHTIASTPVGGKLPCHLMWSLTTFKLSLFC